ncbi:MAG: Ig-like domain-containing protein, partial [Pirellulaceae bacterium]
DTSVEEFSSTPPTAAVIGETLVYDVQNPEEADAGFSYSIDDLLTGMTINATTGVITWIPMAAQLGSQQVTVKATDAAGNSRLQTMTLEVTGEVLVNFRLDAIDSLGNVLTEVTVGDDFTLRGFVQDLRTTPQGVAAGYLDAVIENQLVSITGPITFGDLYQNAISGDLSQAGLVDEVGAMSGLSTGDGDEKVLFSVPVRANLAGTEVFSSNAADVLPQHDTLLYGSNDPVNTAKIAYQSKSLPVNVGFTVESDLFNFDEDSQGVTLDVLLNDTPASGGEALTISSVGTPDENGTVSIASDGKTLIYSPAADYFGVESITYTASDSTGSLQGTVVVQVHPQGDDPTATGDLVTVDANSENVFLDLLQNDSFAPDVGEELEIIAVSATSQNGLVTIGPSGTHVLYTPAANFNGVDTFSYTISDENDGQAVGNVTVQVGEIDDETAPTANNDVFTFAEDSAMQTLGVLANDTLGTDGGSLVISTVTSPTQGGTVQLATDSLALLYTPAADFFGNELFTYTIGDGNGGVAVGQVTVTVTAENDPPLATSDTFDVVKNITAQVLDPLSNDSIAPDEGESLTITAVGTADQGGTVTIAGDGLSLLYTPATDFDAQETFTYTIGDGSGETAQATVTVNVLDYVPSTLAGSVYIDANNDGL